MQPVTTKRASARLCVGEVEHRLDGLLAGRVDEGAGVGDDEIGLVGGGGETVALGLQEPGELGGVHVVLGAPERLDPVPHNVPFT